MTEVILVGAGEGELKGGLVGSEDGLLLGNIVGTGVPYGEGRIFVEAAKRLLGAGGGRSC